MSKRSFLFSFFIVLLSLFSTLFNDEKTTNASDELSVENAEQTDAVRTAIVGDWRRQEEDAGRDGFSRAALSELVKRSRETLAWASEQDWASDERLISIEKELNAAEAVAKGVPENDFQTPYCALRTAVRELLLANPDVSGKPLVFLKSERFTWQMLHEFLSYYYDECGMNGGGLYVLKEPGRSFETEALTDGIFPKGVFETPSLSFDGKTIYFAFADLSNVQEDNQPKTGPGELGGRISFDAEFETNYMKKTDGKFHLYRMNLPDGSVEQLTDGPDDDFDPIELPNGDVAFMSTRRGGFGRCHGGWEPLRVHSLHRLNRNDGSVKRLSWHETNEWQPTVLNDGRILYTRWDYVDRNAARHHGLWATNPDGTSAVSVFGNYTYDVNACYQAKQVPNSSKILFVGGAHHLNVGGSLLMLDPSKIRYDEETSLDDLSAVEMLTPEIDLPEVAAATDRVCRQYYHSPWPLSEDVYLTAFSHNALGGYLARTESCGKTGLYYRDRLGNLELLYEDDSIFSSMYPIPLAERERPRIVPSSLPEIIEKENATGTFVLSNVYESVQPFPKDRKIKELRIFQLLPKGPDHRGNVPAIGHAYAANARLLLGTVPVEEDGSAHFRVPAQTPVYFQAVDESGRAVQTMRSLAYLQPGENRGCVGCHEQISSVQANAEGRSVASSRAPSAIVPDSEFTRPFSYSLFVQPILERACVGCHSDAENAPKPTLTSENDGDFSRSYNELKPFLRWYEWGGANYREISTFPGESGADISPLTKILDDETHSKIELSEQDKRNLYLWLDSNVPFYGVYESSEQARQRSGEVVPIPTLQ